MYLSVPKDVNKKNIVNIKIKLTKININSFAVNSFTEKN